MQNIWKYIIAGIIFIAPGEFLINAIVFGSGASFLMAAALYVVLLAAGYGLWEITKHIKPKSLEFTLSAVILGFLGLMAEWFIIGNAPWLNPDAVQLGMFAWWVGVFIIPRLFLEKKSYNHAKKKVLWFHIIFSLIYLAPSILGAVNVGIVIFSYGMIVWLPIEIWYISKK